MKEFVIMSLLVAALISLAGSDDYTLSNAKYTVKSGQTVWEIASAYMEKQDKIRDVRELVWEIRQKNGLTNCIVHPGQVLEIPLWKAEKSNYNWLATLTKKHVTNRRKKNAETE